MVRLFLISHVDLDPGVGRFHFLGAFRVALMIFWNLKGPRNFRRGEVHAALSCIWARIIILILPSVDTGIEICLLWTEILFL